MAAIDVSAPKLMQSITLRVRYLGVLRARLWLSMKIMRLAAIIAGCGIEIEAGDEAGR